MVWKYRCLPPYRLLAPVTYKTIFIIRYVGAVVNQGKKFILYLVVWVHGIAEIEHCGNHSKWFLLLVVRQWIQQPLVTMSFCYEAQKWLPANWIALLRNTARSRWQ